MALCFLGMHARGDGACAHAPCALHANHRLGQEQPPAGFYGIVVGQLFDDKVGHVGLT